MTLEPITITDTGAVSGLPGLVGARVVEQKPSAARQLRTALGLAPDGPVIEWHGWGEVAAEPDPWTGPVGVTRYRPYGTGEPAGLPAWSDVWEGRAGNTSYRRAASSDDPPGAGRYMAAAAAHVSRDDSPRTEYLYQLRTDQEIPPGPLNGEFRSIWKVSGNTSSATPEFTFRVLARIVSSDGLVVRGTIFDGWSAPISATTATLSRVVAGAILPGVTAQAGDRLVVEIGGHVGAHTSIYERIARVNGYSSSTTDDMSYVDNVSAPPGGAWFEIDLYAPPTPPPEPSGSGWVVDPERTAALTEYGVTYGRQDPTATPDPLGATVELARPIAAGALPQIAERFRLTIAEDVATALGLAADYRPRFTGEVTDVDLDPITGRVQVAAVGRSARLSRLSAGRYDLPEQPADARITRVIDDAAALDPALTRGTIDPDPAVLLAAAVESTTAGDLIGVASSSTGGQLIEQRTGALDWHGPDHRRTSTVVAALTGAAELLRPFRWAQGIGQVANLIDVGYGPADARGVATVAAESADPADLGPLGMQLDTALVDAAAAYARGTDVMGRRSRPTWLLPQVVVDLVRSAGAQAAGCLAARFGDRLDLAALPADGPYAATEAYIEGAAETFTRTAWQITYTVSDPVIGGVGIRWLDAPPALTWDGVDPALTWVAVAPLTNPTDLEA